MSPRAACRLEALGFEDVFDYVLGKADWLGNGLPREGQTEAVPYAGELVDREPPTCTLDTPVADIRAQLDASRYGFSLVLSARRVLLGRVRASVLTPASDAATAESVMDDGPSTVRFNVPAQELVQRLADKNLRTAIVTAPNGCLVGVFHRQDVEKAWAVRGYKR